MSRIDYLLDALKQSKQRVEVQKRQLDEMAHVLDEIQACIQIADTDELRVLANRLLSHDHYISSQELWSLIHELSYILQEEVSDRECAMGPEPRMAGDTTTDAPPPDGRKKGRKEQ